MKATKDQEMDSDSSLTETWTGGLGLTSNALAQWNYEPDFGGFDDATYFLSTTFGGAKLKLGLNEVWAAAKDPNEFTLPSEESLPFAAQLDSYQLVFPSTSGFTEVDEIGAAYHSQQGIDDMILYDLRIDVLTGTSPTVTFSSVMGPSWDAAVTSTITNGLILDLSNPLSPTLTLDGPKTLLNTEITLAMGTHVSYSGSSQSLGIGEAPLNLPVPEPSTYTLAALGVLGLGVLGSRRRRQA